MENNLEIKYSKLLKLVDEMTATRKTLRPDCDKISKKNNSWGINLSQLKKMEKLEFEKSVTAKECFYSFFVFKKACT